MNKKNKIVYLNVVSSFGIKGIALIISLFTMPAYMRFFDNQEILGVWYTILSMLTWILSFDLGIGNGLRNMLSVSIAQDDKEATKGYISSSYYIFGIIVLLIGGLGVILLQFIPWNRVFNVDSNLISQEVLYDVIFWTFIGIILQFYLRLISSVIYALQKAAINNAISLITSVLQLIFALFAPKGTVEQNLHLFSIGYVICSNLPLIVTTIVIFRGPLKGCHPQRKYVSKGCGKSVISLGGLFFVCQIFYMIIANTNEFFISQYTNSGNVVDYQIYYRLFSLGSIFMALALAPVWSMVSKTLAENDLNWLSKIYKKLKVISWGGVVCEFCLIIVAQFIVDIWLGDAAIQINYLYALAFAFFGGAMLYQSMLSTIACGTGRIKLQAICYGGGVLIKILLSHFSMKFISDWSIFVWINVLILIPYCILQELDLNRYLKNDSKN